MDGNGKMECGIPTRPGLDTQTLIDRLLDHAERYGVTGIVTYSSLSAAVEKRIDGSSSNLATARKNLLKSHSQLWICVPGVGVKLATSVEAVDHAMREQMSSCRKVTKSTKTLSAVKVSELDDSDRLQYETAGTLAHCLLRVHSRKARPMIQQMVSDGGSIRDGAAIIKMLANKMS